MKPKFKTPTLVSPPSQTIELTSERQSKSVLVHTNCTSRAEKRWTRSRRLAASGVGDGSSEPRDCSCIESPPTKRNFSCRYGVPDAAEGGKSCILAIRCPRNFDHRAGLVDLEGDSRIILRILYGSSYL